MPKATVVAKSVKMPVKVADKPEDVTPKPTPARERLVEELKKLQTRPRCGPNTVWWVREEHHEPEGAVREDTAIGALGRST